MLNFEQTEVLKFIDNNDNVFITGGAGVGKSYLINEYQKLNSDKNILLCAPTGVASMNIGGATLHRTFKIPTHLLTINEPLNSYRDVMQMLRNVDIIIIDEISMCRQDVFEYVCRFVYYENQDRLKNKYRQGTKPIKLILVGDFYQLPPVITTQEKPLFSEMYSNTEGYAFLSNAWNMLGIKTFELKTVVRQSDKEFSDCLNAIRKCQSPDMDFLNLNKCEHYIENAIYLCSRNAKADEINQKMLEQLKTQKQKFIMRKTGDVKKIKPTDLSVPEELTLKIGCRVMSVINSCNNSYSNGSLGTVIGFDDDDAVVEFDNGNIEHISNHSFDIMEYIMNNGVLEKTIIASYSQLPLKLAYAITIHKSQGQTYDSVNLDLSQIFADGQLYVALSRCKSIQNTYFEGYLGLGKVKVSKTVLEKFG